jgi:hypothetical protein
MDAAQPGWIAQHSDLLLGLLGGAIASWFITHVYSRVSSREQAQLSRKLSAEVRAVILADKRESLSVRQLNDLLHRHTIDPESEKSLPYKACPECGSTSLKWEQDALVDGEMDDGVVVYDHTPYDIVRCMECGWAKSTLDHDG